ncbi:MAG TPA: ABC transporter substrate-binding protein [Cytophagales bacterium]|nr:ABC transporter substrate-binding protein [Cytophagales bacterium]
MLRQFCIVVVSLVFLGSCGKKNSGGMEDGDKKVFRYNQAEGLNSLDPAFARNQANTWATTQLYNGLFELSNDLFVHPALADTWNISPDGKQYTINLKKGIYFHNDPSFADGKGREVVASDFVYSFNRILDQKTASPGAWVFNDKVLKDANGNPSDTCFKAVNKYTLKIYLSRPFPAFLQILSMPYTFVVPKEAVDKYGKDFSSHPVGTGAFSFKSWEVGNSLIMVKNGNYWKRDDRGRQLPYLDAVQVSFIADRGQEFLTFQQGKLDFVSGLDDNSKDLILNRDGSIKKDFKDKFIVQKVPYLNTEYVGFQLDPKLYEDKNHPFFNKKVRQAMSYAINREEMVAYVLNNLGTPGTSGFVPAALPSFDKEKVKGYGYDPDKAAQLLKEAGFPNGKGLPEITIYSTAQSKAFLEYMQKQWANIGVKVEINLNQAATHLDLVNNGKVNFFRASWTGDYPDAENFLSLFYSKNFTPAGPNKTHFSNAEFDKLFEQSLTENDGWKRFDIYQRMDQIIMDEAPVIVLFYDEVLRLTQNNVIGLDTDAMNILKLERADKMKGELQQ